MSPKQNQKILASQTKEERRREKKREEITFLKTKVTFEGSIRERGRKSKKKVGEKSATYHMDIEGFQIPCPFLFLFPAFRVFSFFPPL